MDGDTTQDSSCMNDSQYSIASDNGYSNKVKRPHNSEIIVKATPNFGDDEVVLLCNEKVGIFTMFMLMYFSSITYL